MDRKAAAVIIAGAFVRFVFWLTTPVTGDGALNFATTRHLANTFSFPPVGEPGVIPLWYPPLFHIVTAVFHMLTGALTLTPLLFGILGVYAFYVFARKYYPEHALKSTIILAFLPFHSYYSSIGYFETLLFLLTVSAYYFYLRFLDGGELIHFALAAASCALSALTHYHGFVPLFAIAAHLILSNPRKGVVFFVLGLALASPWYVRNHVAFGNPVWPKVHPGNYPEDIEVDQGSFMDSILSLATPRKWSAVFFDFWIGAPNSGDDVVANIDVGRQRYPLFDAFLIPWLLAIVVATLVALRGAMIMMGDRFTHLCILVFLASLIPFAGNGLARMFVAFVPFFPLAAAWGLRGVTPKHLKVLAVVMVVAFVAGSYAYSYTYRQIRSAYEPFFGQVREGLPENAVVVMPFNVQECLYYTGKKCLRMGSMGGQIPSVDDEVDSVLASYGAGYVCCSSLNLDEHHAGDRLVCDRFLRQEPVIRYDGSGIWGRCWLLP